MSRARESLWGQTTAGLLPGFALAAALTGLFVAALPLNAEAEVVLAVVLLLPAWVGVWALGYRFTSGARAWVWLLAAGLVGQGALWTLRALGGFEALA